MKAIIKGARFDIFLRGDFAHLGATRWQLSRALNELQSELVLVRAGYGLYARPTLGLEDGIKQVQRRLGLGVRRAVTINGITVQLGAPSATPNKQDIQDRRKLAMAKRITNQFAMSIIRSRSLENMERWRKNGVWVSAFDEWRELLTRGTDEQVLVAMTGLDEKSNRLRQSAPYAGLLAQAEVEAI